jgi:hypothetical protein
MTKAIGFAAIRHVRIGTSSTAVVLGTDTSGVEAEAFFRLDDVSGCRWGALVLCSSWRRAVAGSLTGRDRERCGPYRAPRRCWFEGVDHRPALLRAGETAGFRDGDGSNFVI